jgi:hypothetical protein
LPVGIAGNPATFPSAEIHQRLLDANLCQRTYSLALIRPGLLGHVLSRPGLGVEL